MASEADRFVEVTTRLDLALENKYTKLYSKLGFSSEVTNLLAASANNLINICQRNGLKLQNKSLFASIAKKGDIKKKQGLEFSKI
jgi:acetamidase/formamidase